MSNWIEVVCGVIHRGNKLLLCRRAAHKTDGGLWEFPGGKVEAGESMVEALKRELTEELQLTVIAGEVLAVSEAPERRLRMTALRCVALNHPQLDADHDALGWYQVDELAQLTLAPLDIPLLPALLQRFGG